MFTQDELDLLFESLDALRTSSTSNAMLITLLSGILGGPDNLEEGDLEDKYNELHSETSQLVLEERIILLKAKLIGMRDAAVVAAAFDGLTEEVEKSYPK